MCFLLDAAILLAVLSVTTYRLSQSNDKYVSPSLSVLRVGFYQNAIRQTKRKPHYSKLHQKVSKTCLHKGVLQYKSYENLSSTEGGHSARRRFWPLMMVTHKCTYLGFKWYTNYRRYGTHR